VRRKKRPNFSPEFKKQLAQRSSEPGVSVSLLAQENNINVNMLFKWRRQLREGLLDGVAHRHAMLPVTIIDDQPTDLVVAAASPTDVADAVAGSQAATDRSGVIELQIANAVMRFDGKADPAMLRAVIAMLRP
jgi:transposase